MAAKRYLFDHLIGHCEKPRRSLMAAFEPDISTCEQVCVAMPDKPWRQPVVLGYATAFKWWRIAEQVVVLVGV